MKTSAKILTFFLITISPAMAGTVYKVTSKKADKAITYEVSFGGGMMFEQYTAFDPASGKFVYLSFKRGENPPKPVCQIFNHSTGKTVNLYKFPKVENPLPVIPNLKDMKVCPKTGDASFTAKAHIAYD